MAQQLGLRDRARDYFYDSKVGRRTLLVMASITAWWLQVQDLVVLAKEEKIGSGTSPLSGDTPSATAGATAKSAAAASGTGTGSGGIASTAGSGISQATNMGGTKATANEQVKAATTDFANLMYWVMGVTFVIGFTCALAGLFANSAKLSMAIQEGNASATQKHIKDQGQFYINTAIAMAGLGILELIAYFVGMGWTVGAS